MNGVKVIFSVLCVCCFPWTGCSSFEEMQRENSRRDVAGTKRMESDLREARRLRDVAHEEKYGRGVEGFRPRVALVEQGGSGRTLVFTEEDLALAEMARAKWEVKKLNEGIAILKEYREMIGEDAWEYASAYGLFRRQCDVVRASQRYYSTQVSPHLDDLPPGPTLKALVKYKQQLLAAIERVKDERRHQDMLAIEREKVRAETERARAETRAVQLAETAEENRERRHEEQMAFKRERLEEERYMINVRRGAAYSAAEAANAARRPTRLMRWCRAW